MADIESPEQTSLDIVHLEIDTRRGDWVWEPVKIIEVIRAIEIEHSDDVMKSVTAMRGQLIGIFKVESDNYARYEGKTVMIRGVEIKLVPRFLRPGHNGKTYSYDDRPRTGTLITIYDAYKQCNRHIDHELFDDHFSRIQGLEVLKQTQPQKTKGSKTLNNNRFLVVKTSTDDMDLGTSIIIQNQTFNIVYEGMKKFCHLCAIRHGKECPRKARFEFLKRIRKDRTEHRKIYADSTMRNANQLALDSNVACMTGGGVGQICNAIALDTKHEEVIIHAGTNEICNNNFTNTDKLHDFVYTVQKATEKLTDLAKSTKVTLVLPSVSTFGGVEDGKAQYFEEKMKEVEVIDIIKLENIEQDFLNHPTEEGTRSIIQQVHSAIGKNLILEAEDGDLAVKQKYSQVRPIYKVGCRGCDTHEFAAQLCAECRKKAKNVDVSPLSALIKSIEDKYFPDIGTAADDISMMNISKRQRDDNEDEKEISPKASRNDV